MHTDMHNQSLSVARSYIESIQRRDRGAVEALIADGAIEIVPFSTSGDPAPQAVFNGKPEVMGYVDLVFQNFPQIKLLDLVYTVSSDASVVFVEARGDLISAGTEKPYRNNYVFKFLIGNGLIAHIHEFANPVAYAKMAGEPLG